MKKIIHNFSSQIKIIYYSFLVSEEVIRFEGIVEKPRSITKEIVMAVGDKLKQHRMDHL